MSMRRQLLTLMAAIAFLGTALLVVGPAEAAAPPPPPVGACYTYGWATRVGEVATQAPVACSGVHNAKTVGVGTALSGTTLASFWAEPNLGHVRRTCATTLKKAENTTWIMYGQASYQQSAYRPTQAQWDAGARWFRCDAVIDGSGRLFAHPRATVALVAPLPVRDRACMDKSYYLVTCSEVHVYRSVAGFGISATTYPTASQWRTSAERGCPRLVSTSYWGYHYPSQAEFAIGDRAITCFNKTTR